MATVFNDLPSAIEEARFLRQEARRHHCVTQRPGDALWVRIERSSKRESIMRQLYTTRQDSFGVVNTGGVEV
jgi:hypothetical protein